jgi:hypothetical protein
MKLLIVIFTLICATTAHINPPTHDEAKLVADIWDAVRLNNLDILYVVFRDFPDIQASFPKFAGKDLDTIAMTPEFETQANHIVSFLTQIFTLGRDADKNTQASLNLINELGKNHKNRGIKKEKFVEFRKALTDYVATSIMWNDDVAAAWNKSFDNMFSVIFSNLDGIFVTAIDV